MVSPPLVMKYLHSSASTNSSGILLLFVATIALGLLSLPSVVADNSFVNADSVWLSLEDESVVGDPSCPCIQRDGNETEYPVGLQESVGEHIDLDLYGFNCGPHDANVLECTEGSSECRSVVPLPFNCDYSYCDRTWCYVDPKTCKLDHTPSSFYKGISYSYATCGDVNRHKHHERIRSLKNKTFRVGYASNSGGWKGAYNIDGSFARNNNWRGPTVDLFRQAALLGGFTINMTEPPEKLVNKSAAFFGNSKFDLCVYAVSLGYLDFCVGGFTINEKRSSITTMYETYSDPIYLISFVEDDGGSSDWEAFKESMSGVFKPFTLGAWLMILLFALPTFGMLMLYHEYDRPGSAFPKNEPVLIEKDDGTGKKSTKVVTIERPKYKYILNSLYMSYLSFFAGSYDQSVVSIGGKINLLGIAFLIMFVLAIYTANLASILTQEALQTAVDSLDMVTRQGLKICASRNKALVVMDAHSVDPKFFVPDPDDGKPGFDGKREEVFDSMRRKDRGDGSKYCDVAIASEEDLQVMHQSAKHCDKIKVGDSLAYGSMGIPIHDRKADELVSLFHVVKSENTMTKALRAAEPKNECPVIGGEGASITIEQLTGVWVIAFSFAVLSLVTKWSQTKRRGTTIETVSKGIPRRESKRVRMFRRFDQWGNGPPVDVVVGSFKYDPEEDELKEVKGGVTLKELQHMRSVDVSM